MPCMSMHTSADHATIHAPVGVEERMRRQSARGKGVLVAADDPLRVREQNEDVRKAVPVPSETPRTSGP